MELLLENALLEARSAEITYFHAQTPLDISMRHSVTRSWIRCTLSSQES